MKLEVTNGVLLMSENSSLISEDQASAQGSVMQLSAGAMLRTAREAQGLHIAALAVALKVPVKKLEALETDRFDLLPDTVFVRALAASICRTLKVDPVPILEKLPPTITPNLKTDESGINAPFHASGDGFELSFLNQFSKPLMLAVLVFLVAAVVLLYFPFTRPIELANAPQSKTAGVTMTQQELTSVATENSLAPGAAAPAQSASLALSSSDVLVAGKTAAVSSMTSLPVAVDEAPSVRETGVGGAGAILVFKAHASCWVEVIDATGVVQVRKIMTTGEVLAVSGSLPLSVVLGRSDATEVQVRGKPFDLTQITKNNVARFKVK